MTSPEKFKVKFPIKQKLIDLSPIKQFPSKKDIRKIKPQEPNYIYFENLKKTNYQMPPRDEPVLCAYKENGNGKEYYEVIGMQTNRVYYIKSYSYSKEAISLFNLETKSSKPILSISLVSLFFTATNFPSFSLSPTVTM